MPKIELPNIESRKLILIILLVTAGFLLNELDPKDQSTGREIEQILAINDFDKQTGLYMKLIERVGPIQAQEDLYRSGLPFTGQTHFLNHTVGNYLFEKYGPGGMVYCKGYFLSACEHQLILRAVGEQGETVIPQIVAACQQSGQDVYSQCGHGIGHGFLALVGYKDLTAALQQCDQVNRLIPDFPVFNCYDGVFMENIWGAHEGRPSPDRWVNPGDLLYPCNANELGGREDYQLACWSNQPTLIYQFKKGDVSAVASVCEQITTASLKTMCYNGLARQIHPVAGSGKDRMFELCDLMPSDEWDSYCVITNVTSSYAVGDRIRPFEICADARTDQDECFSTLAWIIKTYAKSEKDKRESCDRLESERWRESCIN